jgi:hypothetical protein
MKSLPAEFLNVDLALKSRTDPNALIKDWEGRVLVQHVYKSTRGHWLHFNLRFQPKNPSVVIRRFAKLTNRLSLPARRIWSRASKEMDIGIQARGRRSEPGSAEWLLDARVVRTLADLGVRLRVTVYSPFLPTQSGDTLAENLPAVIPPRSVFRVVRGDKRSPEWSKQLGRVFRIGYYGRQDGLDCIWLVNEEGEYEQTADRKFLLRYFEPLRISRETDFFGDNRPKLRPIRSRQKSEPGKPRRRRAKLTRAK